MIKEYICKVCGFMTASQEDIIKHMSQTWEVEEDCCEKKTIDIVYSQEI